LLVPSAYLLLAAFMLLTTIPFKKNGAAAELKAAGVI
jgi:hypothetical protein